MIYLKTDAEINAMRKAGALAGELLDMIETYVKPGISTLEINDIVHAYTVERSGISAPLN